MHNISNKKVVIFVLHFLTFSPDMRIGVVSTIQFVASVQALVEQLKNEGFHLFCPQTKPLSPGETLGCTSPR